MNDSRNSQVVAGLSEICLQLSDIVDSSTTEVFEQGPLTPLGLRLRLKKLQVTITAVFRQEWAIWQFSGDSLRVMRKTLASLAVYPVVAIFQWITRDLRSSKELVLTQKHLASIKIFVESKSKFCIVLEDDAFLLKGYLNASRELVTFLRNYAQDPSSEGLFVNLGNGYPLNMLGVSCSTVAKYQHIESLSNPVANTTSAYLVSRAMATRIIDLVSSKPSLHLLNADFLITECMRLMTSKGLCTCLQLQPPIFDNASLHGRLASSISSI